MNYILFDDYSRNNLLPLTFLRPVADLRFGILTIREKWEKMLNVKTSSLTEEYLSIKYPMVKGANNILINGSVCPSPELVKEIATLKPNEALLSQDSIIALHVIAEDLDKIGEGDTEGIIEIETKSPFTKINYPWEIYAKNAEAIAADFEFLTKGKTSATISSSNKLTAPEMIFIEEGAVVENVILNASEGPIYIGKNAQIWEGSVIRGPFALCNDAIVKMQSIIYGATTIGPFAKIGGEIENSVIMGYSNKPHCGYLGNSVVGQWCNIAAGTNVANLNNTYATVKVWNYPQEKFIDTGQQFCGLIMGDHSKTGINTMFNTGSVVGVNSNVFGHGYQRNFVSSFMWGGPAGYSAYVIHKALDTAMHVLKRRGVDLTEAELEIFRSVYEMTAGNARL
ncbi:MAG: GlmU family protein [Bacteroidales bacterium]|jgi:UDP-N-acetylglucosamine diphosphorylase/glucosamine-1-phosphate N-acetyltransferase|nr:GlmU family protein [Bacteroidales bacterium]